MIKIPKFFNEILGETQKKIELICIILFSLISTIFLFTYYKETLILLPLLNQAILLLLTLDITGGVIANLSFGTDRYYSERKNARLVFIAIHIQSLLIFLFAKLPIWIGIMLWGYTIICALILEKLKNHPSQKVFAGITLFIGLGILFIFETQLTSFISLLMFLFLFKVLYSFSVNHHIGDSNE